MINIDSKLLKALEASTCFGIAHDDTVPECKQCDVKAQCKSKTEGSNIPIPKSKPVREPSPDNKKVVEKKPEKKAEKTLKELVEPVATKVKPQQEKKEVKVQQKPSKSIEEKAASTDLPDFKNMDLESLVLLAKERNVEWKDYGNDSITRMRLIMSLKKSY